MNSDILFKQPDRIFSLRVGGVAVHDGRVLLQRPVGDDYAVIGGHVEFFEESRDTLRREYAEELGADITVGELFAVGEIFFMWGNRPCHQMCLYYFVEIEDGIPLEGSFHGFDDFGGERIGLDFVWVPLEELRNGTLMYPTELVPYILTPPDRPVHFVSRQLGD